MADLIQRKKNNRQMETHYHKFFNLFIHLVKFFLLEKFIKKSHLELDMSDLEIIYPHLTLINRIHALPKFSVVT